jgi:hypothetical protein
MKPVAPRPARLPRRHAVAAGVINDPRISVEFESGRERPLARAMLLHPKLKSILTQPATLGCSRPNGKQGFYFPDYLVERVTERTPSPALGSEAVVVGTAPVTRSLLTSKRLIPSGETA